MEGGCRCRGPYGLWTGPCRFASARRHLRRQDSHGYEARRPSCRAADEVRVRYQSQDREGARPHNSALAAAAGGSDNRMMNRRAFAAGLGAVLATPFAAEGEQARPAPVVGILHDRPAGPSTAIRSLQEGLRQLGYIDGQTISFEIRFSGGKREDLPGLARDLIQRK